MKISKEVLKKKILQVLEIAPYLHENPEDMYLALMKDYPLRAVKECIEELKEEYGTAEECYLTEQTMKELNNGASVHVGNVILVPPNKNG